MGKYVEYNYQTPIETVSEIPTFKLLDPLKYDFVVTRPTIKTEQPTVVTQVTEPKQEVQQSEQSPETKSKLDKVLDFALSKAKKSSTHWCARHVRQALESQGFTPGNSINGWEYEKAAKNMGWKQVTDGSIKKGDLIVTKKYDGRGHVALATKDNADIFNDRTSSVSDFVSRGVPYAKSKVKSVEIFRAALKGMKFAEYTPAPLPNKFKVLESLRKPQLEANMPRLAVQKYEIPKVEEVKPITGDYKQDYQNAKVYKEPKDPVGKAMFYFINKGLSKEQAAGLVGNLIRESKLQIGALNGQSAAFGLAQWLGDRKDNLFKKYGKTPTFEQLLEYIWDELNSTHSNGLRHLRSSKSVEDAAKNAFGYYEFSAGPEGAVRAMNRWGQNGRLSLLDGIKYAKEAYANYKPESYIPELEPKPYIAEPVSTRVNL